MLNCIEQKYTVVPKQNVSPIEGKRCIELTNEKTHVNYLIV